MTIIKHVRWYSDVPVETWDGKSTRSGLLAIRVEHDHIRMKRLAGPPMPARLILMLLENVLPEGWKDRAETLHRERKYPWRVDIHEGMSGAVDFTLRYLRDEAFSDCPVGGRIHVSMNEKLNEGLDIWLGDLPPLLSEMARHLPCIIFPYKQSPADFGYGRPPKENEIREGGINIISWEPPSFEGWHLPGEAVSVPKRAQQYEA